MNKEIKGALRYIQIATHLIDYTGPTFHRCEIYNESPVVLDKIINGKESLSKSLFPFFIYCTLILGLRLMSIFCRTWVKVSYPIQILVGHYQGSGEK